MLIRAGELASSPVEEEDDESDDEDEEVDRVEGLAEDPVNDWEESEDDDCSSNVDVEVVEARAVSK